MYQSPVQSLTLHLISLSICELALEEKLEENPEHYWVWVQSPNKKMQSNNILGKATLFRGEVKDFLIQIISNEESNVWLENLRLTSIKLHIGETFEIVFRLGILWCWV